MGVCYLCENKVRELSLDIFEDPLDKSATTTPLYLYPFHTHSYFFISLNLTVSSSYINKCLVKTQKVKLWLLQLELVILIQSLWI